MNNNSIETYKSNKNYFLHNNMKTRIKLIIAAILLSNSIFAATVEYKEIDDKYIESDVVRLDEKKGLSIETKAGDFAFKPYLLVQTTANYNWYDDEGLNLADQDKIANIGFGIPNAIIGFSGKAFNIITFNIALNPAKSGSNLLQQAWFDINIKDALRIRAGKFKVPYLQGYQTTLGETLFPCLPLSMTTNANLNMSLNAVNPTFGLGFDLGVQLHGIVKEKFQYQVGVFNGNNGGLSANKTMSDDHKGLPSLLYAGRIAFMPFGVMPSHQGIPSDLKNNKLLFGLSANYNVEAEDESSNDFRCGAELSWLYHRFFFSGEFYFLRMNWTERMQQQTAFDQLGGYVQAGYFITDKIQPALRYDFYNRNGLDKKGYLNAPAACFNYYFVRCNLKLQLMYQYMGRYGHETQLDRDNDDTGLATHTAMTLLQYTF